MNDDDLSDGRERSEALQRVRAPGVLLMIVGVLNLLLALLLMVRTVSVMLLDDADLQQAVDQYWNEQMDGEQQRTFAAQGWTPEDFANALRRVAPFVAAWFGACVLFAFLTVLGGWRMTQLRSRGLALTGAALASIPGLSCLSCLLIGEAIGIWCLVVLGNDDITGAFARASSPPV